MPPVCPHDEVPEQNRGNSRASLRAERHIRTDACSLFSGRASGQRRRGEAGPDHMDARCSIHSALNCAWIDLTIVRPSRVAVGMFAASWPIPFVVVSHGARPARSRFGMSDRQSASPRSVCRNGGTELSSPAGCAAIPRETRKSPFRRPPFHCGPCESTPLRERDGDPGGMRTDRSRSLRQPSRSYE